MSSHPFDYKVGDCLLKGYVSYPKQASETTPVVMVCPDWTGRSRFSDKKADELAQLGYIGFSIDIYGNGQQGKNNQEKMELMQPFLDDRALLRQRMIAAFTAAQGFSSSHRSIAIIGFCFGGLCALDAARSGMDLSGVVSFHGSLSAPTGLAQHPIKAKILILQGFDDPMVPTDQTLQFAKEMNEADVDWQIHYYGKTMHAFTNPVANDPGIGTLYNPAAEKRSMLVMRNFLAETL